MQKHVYNATASIQCKSKLCLSRVCKGEHRVRRQGDLVLLLTDPGDMHASVDEEGDFFVAADKGKSWRELQLGTATLLHDTGCAWQNMQDVPVVQRWNSCPI